MNLPAWPPALSPLHRRALRDGLVIAGLVYLAWRESRHLGIALGATAAIVVVSLVLDGRLWTDWVTAPGRDAAAPLGGPLASPLWLRLPICGAVVVWGARSDRPWTVPMAATIAMPVVWIATLSVLTPLFAIGRPELRPRLH